jgi:AcrR family transcriptional regulator
MVARREGRGGNDAGAETRQRIMAVAERLFAQRGLDAVSIRDITAAAGVNLAAVNYHFGSKQQLVVAVLERRAEQLGARRALILDEIGQAHEPTLREVIAALVVPVAEFAADRRHGGQYYVGFIAAVVNHPDYVQLVSETFDPITNRYLEALERVTPHLPPDVRAFRFAVAKDFINRALSQPAAVHEWIEQHAPGADEPLTERIVDFLTGAFAGPAESRRVIRGT